MNKGELDRFMKRCQKNRFDENDDEATYDWKVFGTLTVPVYLSFPQSRRIFYRWVAEIEKLLPHTSNILNWFAVVEHNRWGYYVRIHFMMGGSQLSFEPRCITRWQKLTGGDGTVFNCRRGAFSAYVIRKTQADHYFAVGMDLCAWGLSEIGHERRGVRERGSKGDRQVQQDEIIG